MIAVACMLYKDSYLMKELRSTWTIPNRTSSIKKCKNFHIITISIDNFVTRMRHWRGNERGDKVLVGLKNWKYCAKYCNNKAAQRLSNSFNSEAIGRKNKQMFLVEQIIIFWVLISKQEKEIILFENNLLVAKKQHLFYYFQVATAKMLQWPSEVPWKKCYYQSAMH